MSLRLKINLIVLALTVLFAATVLALEIRSMRESVNEEVVAANRVAALLLALATMLAWSGALLLRHRRATSGRVP